ncbi:MAG: glycosyltransferase family 4 protein [Deltaproteobacteria bacterium]|nr:glycosyltransferase family 4 protein [Deltaproteobacteria bacterium]
MNILLSPTSYLPRTGGVQVAVQNLARAFREMGHEVVIVTPRLDQAHPTFEIIEGIEVHRMPFALPWRLLWQNPQEGFLKTCLYGPAALRGLTRLMNEKRVDIVNVHHVGPQLPYLLFARWFKRSRMVLTLHGTELFRLNPKSERIRSFFISHALGSAGQIIGVSPPVADETGRSFPKAFGKIVTISNGVAVEEFTDCAPFPSPSPYILSLSRLNPIKGHDVLLRAFQEVARNETDIRLIIAADGPLRIRLHALSLALGLKDRVTFLGQVDRKKIKELLAGCEFLVNCSWIEGIPNAVLEAMAAGKAVIVTRVGGLPEVVSDFHTGRLVPPGDPQSLAKAMLFLLQDRNRTKTMGERGRNFVKLHHGFGQTAERYLEVYRKVLRDSGECVGASAGKQIQENNTKRSFNGGT